MKDVAIHDTLFPLPNIYRWTIPTIPNGG